MDRAAVALGSGLTAVLVAVTLLQTVSFVAVGAALATAGALTGAGSRTFQSEFRDAWVAGTLGFGVGASIVFFGFGGWQTLARQFSQAPRAAAINAAGVFLASWLLAPVFALVSAAGGEFGARARLSVERRLGGGR